MNEQAAAHYMTALRKKPDNLDALTGLKRTGQIVLAQHFATFDEAVLRNEREAAIDAFQKADKYNNLVASVGVTLAFPAEKRNMYESVKNAHVEEIYVEGSSHLEKEEYAEALVIFERIEELVPGLKTLSNLLTTATASLVTLKQKATWKMKCTVLLTDFILKSLYEIQDMKTQQTYFKKL